MAKKIEVVFENCEVIEVSPQEIDVKVSGEKPLDVIKENGKNIPRYSVDTMTITINPSAVELRKRICKNKDITWIYITSYNGTEFALQAPWNDLLEEENTYQHCEFTSNGMMIVKIKPNQAKVNRDGVFVCPFCRKEYRSIYQFADCVASCRKRQEEMEEKATRQKAYADIEFACSSLQKMVSQYESKYHCRLSDLHKDIFQ